MVDEMDSLLLAKDSNGGRELKEELRRMGVEVNHNLLTWKGPNGLSGTVKGGRQIGPDDWLCPSCNIMVFCRKGKSDSCYYKCFKCGGRRDVDTRDQQSGRNRGGRDWSYNQGA